MQAEQIPSIIKEILLGNSLSRDGGHVFDNMVQRCSSQSCRNMPPIMVRMIGLFNLSILDIHVLFLIYFVIAQVLKYSLSENVAIFVNIGFWV